MPFLEKQSCSGGLFVDNAEYFNVLLDNKTYYSLSLIATMLIYYVFLRRFVFSMLDPLFYNFFFSALASSTVFFLWSVDKIDDLLLFHFVFTQSIFFVFFVFFEKIFSVYFFRLKRSKIHFFSQWDNFFYFCSLSSFVFLFSLSVYFFGIPALNEMDGGSRLQNYNDSLFSNIKRFLDVFYVVIVFFALKIIFISNNGLVGRFLAYFGLMIVIFYGVSLGSKSFFVEFLSVIFLFFFWFFGSSSNPLNRYVKFLIPIALFGCILMIYSKSANAFYYLVYRLVISGDTFYMSYPDNAYLLIDSANWFVATFNGILKNLHVISQDEVLTPLGYKLYRLYYPVDYIGPNPRHNVFGLIYYGFFGAFFYSAILGLVLGLCRGLWRARRGGRWFESILFSLLIVAASRLELDIALAITGFINALVIYPLIFILFYFLYRFFSFSSSSFFEKNS